MTDFSTITTSYRPSNAIPSQSEQKPDRQIQLDETTHSPLQSAMERLARAVRAVVARLDNWNTALKATAAAAKAVSPPPVPGPVDFAAGEEGVRDYFKARYSENQKFQRAMHEVLAKGAASQVPAQLAKAELLKLSALGLPDTPEARLLANDTLERLRSQLPDAPNQINSSGDFFDQLRELIDFIGEEYLKIYAELMTKYSAFYKEFNEQIMANLGNWITGKNDGKDVEISGDLYTALNNLLNKYSTPPEGVLYPLPDSDPATLEDAEKWALAMGLITQEDIDNKTAKYYEIVNPDGSGGYRVMMDVSPLRTMRDKAPRNGATWDSAKFQAWQTGFNSLEGELKNQLQLFSTKYGNANSYHENFNKILSSQLSQFAEMLKAYTSY